jgi:hypothetical protein
MASKNPKAPSAGTPRNEGEGNKSADRHYREATQEFVKSNRGKREIRHAGDVSASEERDIEAAEEQAKSHARGHDPEELKGRHKPA